MLNLPEFEQYASWLLPLIIGLAAAGFALLVLLAVRAYELQQELSIKKHKVATPSVADLLPWAAEVDDGVIVCKNGSFLAAFLYQPEDPAFVSAEDQMLVSDRVNTAIQNLGDGWMLHIDAVRRESADYPAANRSHFPDRMSRAIETERRRFFTSTATMYETYFIITVTWRPPALAEQKLVEMLFDDDKAKPTRTQRTEALVAEFKKKIHSFASSLSNAFPKLEQLSTHRAFDMNGDPEVLDDLLSWLHFCVTGLNHPIRLPEAAMYLDRVIGGQEFWAGVTPKIGRKFIAVVSIEGFPSGTYPGILNEISQLDAAYRWSTRFIAMDRPSAEAHIEKYRRMWAQKVRGFFDQIFNKANGRVNADALAMVQDADAMKAEVSSQQVNAGYYTSCLILMDEDRDQLAKNALEASKVLSRLGFANRVETLNAIEAWLGSLPGDGISNIRRPLITTLNLADLMPTRGIWTGAPVCPCPFYPPDSPPLMHCVTAGHTPFRLNLHVGDLGHTLILGPTGAGKSTLLGIIAAQALRYLGMTVFAFDRGRSIKALCEACGGSFYEIGGEVTLSDRRRKGDAWNLEVERSEALRTGKKPAQFVRAKGLAFAPLLHIGEPAERVWARTWLEDLFSVNSIALTPAQRNDISRALDLLAGQKDSPNNLTGVYLYLNDEELKEVLQSYLSEDESSSMPQTGILDATEDAIGETYFSAFELDELMTLGPKIAMPVVSYLFHRIERSLHGQPAVIIFDEAWAVISHPIFRSKIRQWFKTLRKLNAAVVLATQSLSDVTSSGDMAAVISESCLTKIFLPNSAALQPGSRELYESMGLRLTQIQCIQRAIPKREYLVSTPYGHRLVSLAMQPLSLAVIGASDRESLEKIEVLKQQKGAGWLDAWLAEKGLSLTDFDND